ncbi:MAG TPA: helix-turn-helix domain-containing protein [Vicinamibacteria bacterium]|nr:helix-turn-helix domain-containing protein [Vicinamibacteria bacterium]
MLALLVAEDPRRSADRILTRLVQIHQARGGAILRPRQDQAEIWLSAGLSLSAVAELPVRWTDHRAALAAGQTVVEAGFALVPAMLGDDMVAALYLAQPENLAVSDVRVFGAAIAQAVQAAASPGPRWALPETSPTEETRLQLLSLLERHEWNIAEVARLLGVTRRTVYMRLQSFGIERKHVPKIYKKLPVEG